MSSSTSAVQRPRTFRSQKLTTGQVSAILEQSKRSSRSQPSLVTR
jgi:hypothetical protein